MDARQRAYEDWRRGSIMPEDEPSDYVFKAGWNAALAAIELRDITAPTPVCLDNCRQGRDCDCGSSEGFNWLLTILIIVLVTFFIGTAIKYGQDIKYPCDTFLKNKLAVPPATK